MKTTSIALLGVAVVGTAAAQMQYTGINLAGAEFGENFPGTHGADYTYPTESSVSYFADKGMNTFRVPFSWERVQRTLGGEFDQVELGRLNTIIDTITGKYAKFAILDPHNYARYNGNKIEESGIVTNAHFSDFWTKLANLFKDNPRVIFGLMNEPKEMSTAGWANTAKIAVQAIRGTGANQLILVPGNGWTGAHSWESNWYDLSGNANSNADVFEGFTDSNFAFELHQYFDGDFSGRVASCTNPANLKGSETLTGVTAWLKQRNFKGFLGEFAGGDNADCTTMLTDTLDFMTQNSDVWIGFTWWAAGGAWPQDYIFNLEPIGQTERNQVALLQKYVSTVDPVTQPPVTSGGSITKPPTMASTIASTIASTSGALKLSTLLSVTFVVLSSLL